jgi:ADP-ribose pyrophosphatase YjhB (NUDIX family)
MLYKIAGKIWKVMPRRMRVLVSRSIQPKFTVSAAGVIVNEAGEVLLLNHVLRPDSGWGIPGGFLDAGEQPEAAFRREIKEETDLDLRDVSIYRARTLKRHIEIIFIATAIGEARVMSKEILELDWFTAETVPPEMSLDQQFLVRKALGWNAEATKF